MAVLLLGLGASTWQAIRATRAERKTASALKAADEQRDEARKQRLRAEANLRKARDAVDQMLTEVGDQLADVPRTEKLRRSLLEKALAFQEGFVRERGDDPEVRLEAARGYLRLGQVGRQLGQFQPAEQALRRAVELYQELAAEYPKTPAPRSGLAASLKILGYALAGLGKPPADAEQVHYRRALRLYEDLERFSFDCAG